MKKYKPVRGEVFGRWVVVGDAIQSGKNPKILCECVCGTVRSVTTRDLFDGTSASCGCLAREKSKTRKTSHGMSYSKEYNAWHSMLGRCRNTNDVNFHNYGGRGITVCDRWTVFENFFEDMGRIPEPGMSLDRIDNAGPYCKENCRWTTWVVQNNNKRGTHLIEIDGLTKTISQWCKFHGMPHKTVRARLANGWAALDALTIPVGSVGNLRNGGYSLLRKGRP